MNKSSTQQEESRATTTIRVLPSLWESVQIQAIRERKSASDLVEKALRAYLSSICAS
jgi:predicted HicB family RNase H-like nuclease